VAWLRTEAAHEYGDIVATGRTSAIGVIAGSGFIVRELSFSPKETRVHKWDQPSGADRVRRFPA
jgi:hypothetical protein